MASRILVIGGAGFVGAVLSAALTKQGHQVAVYDNYSIQRSANARPSGELNVYRGDILDFSTLSSCLQQFAPTAIIHLAAHHYIPFCNAHPNETIETNVQALDVIASAVAATAPDSELLFTSSAAVYAPIQMGSLSEQSPTGPRDIYGATKLLGEYLCKDRFKKLKIIRLFNVIGPNDPHPHLLPRIHDQATTRSEIVLGNPNSSRDYIDVRDVAQAYQAILEDGRVGETYNVGTDSATTVRELCDMYQAIAGTTLPVSYDTSAYREIDSPLLRADTSKLRAHTGWRAQYTPQDTIRSIMTAGS